MDGPKAIELADAFRKFEQDESLSVAFLWGRGGTYCAGADLKAVADPQMQRLNRLAYEGDGPMGPSRMMLNRSDGLNELNKLIFCLQSNWL